MSLAYFEPPALRTLSRTPSWVNRAGRVDRSACFEVRASELWPHIAPEQWRETRAPSGRLARAEFIVSARLLRTLHDSRPPQQLIGDWRTVKSNVMKGPSEKVTKGLSDKGTKGKQTHSAAAHSVPLSLRPSVPIPSHSVPLSSDLSPAFAPNPNKGATRTKKLGLWGAGQLGFPDHEWEQQVRVEKWERLKKTVTKGQRDKGTKGKASAAFHSVPLSLCHSVPVFTPPTHQHFLICPACGMKMLKLMMVLATDSECNDADIAEGWVRMIDAHPRRDFLINNTELGTRYSELVRRYGVLFRGRRLLCRTCLGVRYGEVKPKRRRKNDLIIIKNPRTSAGGRRRSPQRASKLTREQRAALRELSNLMKSIRRSNELIAKFRHR